MSVSTFNPTYAANTAPAPAMNAPVANALPTANAAAPTLNTTDTFTANQAPAPLEGLPAVNAAPTANTAPAADTYMPTQNAPVANAPTANAPTANAPVVNAAPAPVQPKSTGGFLGGLLAAVGGGLIALKGIVPKFLPSLLQNASRLKIGGIFGAGALAGTLIYSFVKSKLSGAPANQGVQSQTVPPQVIAEVQAYLKQGVPPQVLAQQGVPVEILRMAGAQI